MHAASRNNSIVFLSGFLFIAMFTLSVSTLSQAIENYALVRGHLQEVSKCFPPCLAAAAPEGLTQEEERARKGYARDQRRRNEAAAFVRKAKEAEEAGLRAIEQIARTI